ncbi:MAG: DUF2147 domain-containing protein [Bacteroidales bacterium]|nr:DUF2147 domain-containing protein [Bacteroidales bacterium]
MKRIILTLAAAFAALSMFAQNDKADNILGTYNAGAGKDAYKVKIEKMPDASYKASICWLADPYDESGKIAKDTKNPDKALRDTPMDKVVLISGLKYNKEKQRWDGAKIYDPQRGIKVNVTVSFENAKKLNVRGTVMGIGETVVWTKE